LGRGDRLDAIASSQKRLLAMTPKLRIDILTIFPRMFEGPLTESLIGKAREKGLLNLRVLDIRDFTDDKKHRTVDDRPYGGGPGMVMKAEPIFRALRACGVPANKGAGRSAEGTAKKGKGPVVIFMSPQGRPLTQELADELALKKRLVLLCGHYEGIDERLHDWIDLEVSVGDVVYTGGEIPAMALADAVTRQVPGTIKEKDSLAWDSFAGGWDGGLDCPHFTRPALWRRRAVPPPLLSGDHKAIQAWRSAQARANTLKKRPDLLKLKRK
jgi:tRNA (guanine37-N1)-methyltransferase